MPDVDGTRGLDLHRHCVTVSVRVSVRLKIRIRIGIRLGLGLGLGLELGLGVGLCMHCPTVLFISSKPDMTSLQASNA